MRFGVIVLFVIFGIASSRRKDEQEDFEFIEDAKSKSLSGKGPLVWISDPNNELCSLLRCGSDDICLLQDKFTAVCVNKKDAEKYGDRIVPAKESSQPKVAETKFKDYVEEDDDEDDEYLLDDNDDFDDEQFETNDNSVPKLIRRPFARQQCPTCPVVKPVFLCGSDNKTYSSVCRLNLHNCLHEANVRISCKGFCPCKEVNVHQARKDKQRQRMTSYMKKLRATAKNAETTAEPAETKSKYQDKPWKKSHKSSKKYYKDDKYTKYEKEYKPYDKYWSKKKSWQYSRKNEVSYEPNNNMWGITADCNDEALTDMGNRMLDWFSVLMVDSRHQSSTPLIGPSWCKKEVAWMFGHLDQDHDLNLNEKELYRLEHDDREKCIKPFFDRCDLNRNSVLSPHEWCKCFYKAQRPCAAMRKASKGLLGGYIPECDSEGYYRPTQCHVSAAICWCVNKHGSEIAGTRTRQAPRCESMDLQNNRIDDDSESDDDMDRYEGSANMPLDI